MNQIDVLKEIVKDSYPKGWVEFIKTCKKIQLWILGSAGSFFSVHNNFINHASLVWFPFTENKYCNSGILFLFLLLILLIALQIKHFIKSAWRKYILTNGEAVYGNAIILLSNAYAEIHKKRSKEIGDTEVKEVLQGFCDSVREIFEFKTKARCNVSIKVAVDLKGNEEITFQTELKNLVRDNNSGSRDTPTYEGITHKIANNTPYQIIMSNYFSGRIDKLFFRCNDLPSLSEYLNSSLEQYPDYQKNYIDTTEYRRNNWPLPYRSELVVCLSPLHPTNEDKLPIIGFLCVDCELEKKEVFNSKYDILMVRGIADGLYEFIKNNIFLKHEELIISSNNSNENPN